MSFFDEDCDFLFKLILVGDFASGKSSLLSRFLYKSYTPKSPNSRRQINSKVISLKEKNIKLELWDTKGEERFRVLQENYYTGAVGALLVYDITNYDSFRNVKKWLREVRGFTEAGLPMVLIGNKVDLEEDRAVKEDEGRGLAESEGVEFVETSARLNVNVEKVFERLLEEVMEKVERAERGRLTLTDSTASRTGRSWKGRSIASMEISKEIIEMHEKEEDDEQSIEEKSRECCTCLIF